jgi:RNA polymerase sigma factor (sigma-70 family)
MATGQLHSVLHNVRRTALLGDDGGPTDGQLLDVFLDHADEAAFETLVRRHGPMIWGVCLRVLGNAHDAEDAFQATFLVLVRKAATVWPRAQVGNWLYGVAYRTALKAKGAASKRRAREKQVADMPATAVSDTHAWSDLRLLLDRELNRLADRYRVPIVLCDLEGKSQREAARQLGWPEGTLMTRLARARRLLAQRLARHGLALSAGSLALALSTNAAAAQAPAPLVGSTIKAAALLATGHALSATVSAPVAALTEGVLRAMFLSKLKNALTIALVVLLLAPGAGLITQHVLAERSDRSVPGPNRPALRADAPLPTAPARVDAADQVIAFQREGVQRDGVQRQEVRGLVKSVDVKAATISVTIGGGRGADPVDKTYALAKDVEVAVGSSGGARFSGATGLLKEGKLADLTEGLGVSLLLSADQKTVESILAEEPTVHGLLKAVDAKQNKLTISSPKRGRDADAEEHTYSVAANAEIALDNGRGLRHSLREGQLGDLSAGAIVTLRLSLDRQQVLGVLAEGATLSGLLKAIDPDKRTLTVTSGAGRGEAVEEQTVTIARDALVVVDDGKGRLLSRKEARLADVPVGAAVALKFSADQTVVMAVRAEGATLFGVLKGVDPAKETITISMPRGRGEDADEKTVVVVRDARITLDGKEVKLADLKAGDTPPHIHLRLTLDQKAAQSVTAGQAERRQR